MRISAQVLLHKDPCGDCASRARARQSQEAEVMLLAMLVGDVKTRQADRRARKVEGPHRPDQTGKLKGKVRREAGNVRFE